MTSDHPENEDPLDTEEFLTSEKQLEETEENIGESLLIFRISEYWMALPTIAIKEVTEISPIHIIPNRTTDTLLGITNVDGVLHIAFSLKALLGIEEKPSSENTLSHQVYPRAILFGFEKNDFVFSADEVFGTTHIRNNEFIPPESSLPGTLLPFVNNAFIFKEKPVTLLSDDRILETINKEHL